MKIKQKSPGEQPTTNHNRHPRRVLNAALGVGSSALTLALLVGAYSGGGNTESKAITKPTAAAAGPSKARFSSYEQATAALKPLAEKYDGTYNLPKGVGGEIRHSLADSTPEISKHFSETVSSLVGQHRGSSRITVDGAEKVFGFTSTVNDDGETVDFISGGTEGMVSESFTVTHKKKGGTKISYERSQSNGKGGSIFITSLDVEGKHIDAYHEFDADGDLHTDADTKSSLVQFGGRSFGAWSGEGPSLSKVIHAVDAADKFLAQATDAAQHVNEA